jgi:acyl-CoA synthetase (AMP-forming)/AMP-acid ligase II
LFGVAMWVRFYAQLMLRALTHHAEAPAERLTRAELRDRVARTAASLQAVGVVQGGRMVAIVRNDAASATTRRR